MGIYLPGAGTLSWVVWCGAGILIPEASLLIFIYHMFVGLPVPCLQTSPHLHASLRFSALLHASPRLLHASPCIFVSSPLLPSWMNVASLIPWLSDFIQLDFLMILDDIFL